jgi:hypothetical protein
MGSGIKLCVKCQDALMMAHAVGGEVQLCASCMAITIGALPKQYSMPIQYPWRQGSTTAATGDGEIR